MEIVLNREITHSKVISRVIGITAFAIMMCLGAFVRVPLPFSPVPLTLQTFFVLLGAALLGRNRGAKSQLAYILAGAAGLPVFSGAGAGLAYLCGPTAGYLLGFIAASLFIGWTLGRLKTKWLVFPVLLAADLLLLALGALWLAVFFKYSFAQAFALGVLPFIPGDLCKAAAAYLVYRKLQHRCSEIF